MESVFSGMKYNPSMNNTTHYYAGKKPIKSNNKKVKKSKKPRVKSVFTGSCDLRDKSCNGNLYTRGEGKLLSPTPSTASGMFGA